MNGEGKIGNLVLYISRERKHGKKLWYSVVVTLLQLVKRHDQNLNLPALNMCHSN